jgi:hypothetical protein
MRELFRCAGLDSGSFGTPGWNPLGEFVPAGSCVLIKPNWVNHRNGSGAGMDCLVTHFSVISAVLRYALLAHPQSIIIGDAPLQGCNFAELRSACNLDSLAEMGQRSSATKGGSRHGGDCYAGGGAFKAWVEDLLDLANRLERHLPRRMLIAAAMAPVRLSGALGNDANIEGSWHDNDTV